MEAMTRLNDNLTREIVFGGAKGGGKSYLGCSKFIPNCLFYPETRYFIARHELNDLRKYTIPSINEFCTKSGFRLSNYAKYNGQDNYFQFNNGSRLDFLSCKYLPSDQLYERFGSTQYTQGWIEEGGEVAGLAYVNLKLSIGRCLNDKYNLPYKLLITCNPKKNFLYHDFYKPFKSGKLSPEKAFIVSYCTDNTFNPTDYVRTLDEIKDNVTRQRLRFGNWEYDSDSTCLIEYDKITDIFTNTFINDGQPYLTCDVARLGKDTSTIGIWSGLRLIKIITIDKCLVTELAYKIRDLSYTYHIPLSNVIVDEDGVGGGVKDILGCKGFVNNSRSISGNYTNLKSECYYTLAKYVNESNIFIDVNENEKLKTMIIEELEQVKSKDEITEGKLAVISKEEVKKLIGRSPDNSDMIMMRMYFEIYKQTQYVDYG
jgi:hypothetical protein